MTKSLKTLAKQADSTHETVTVVERLPLFIQAPCVLNCEFTVERRHGYYQLSLEVRGTLNVTCQRCLGCFEYAYQQRSDVALCPNEDVAERLMASMDCVVNPDDDIDLLAIVTDELHLFCPEKHPDPTACDAFAHEVLNVN